MIPCVTDFITALSLTSAGYLQIGFTGPLFSTLSFTVERYLKKVRIRLPENVNNLDSRDSPCVSLWP
jgi:hypothetical protein